jgi:hypothetical protein
LGEWVFGFFLDSLSAQEPAILGYLPAIPEAASEYFGTPPNMTRNFATVTQKDSVVWNVNDAKISLANNGIAEMSANNTLRLHGNTELRLSDGLNNTTLNELILRIKALEDKNILQDAEIAVAKTLPLPPP